MKYIHTKTTITTSLIALLTIAGAVVSTSSASTTIDGHELLIKAPSDIPQIQIARPDPIVLQDQTLFTPVDKMHEIKDYVPADLVPIRGFTQFTLREEPEQALFEMISQAREEGIALNIISGYRSFDTQATLFYNYSQAYGVEEANTFSALPGHSEHQLGTTVDFGVRPGIDFTSSFDETPQGKWLIENSSKFGFVMSYPKGKEDVTGYIYEPWHYRYIGEELAQRYVESGLTLNQFLLIY